MQPETLIAQCGGRISWRQLRRVCGLVKARRAIRAGTVVRLRRGLYGLAIQEGARATAEARRAVVSDLSAAQHWGWGVKTPAERLDLAVRPNSRGLLGPADEPVAVHWRSMEPDDVVDGWVTSTVRTVIDCCIDLPFDEALAVFDSAWREGERTKGRRGVHPRQVLERAERLGPRQRSRVERVAAAASWRAANAFESVLRAIAIESGLCPTAQAILVLPLGEYKVDLADSSWGLVIEAESKAHHSSGASLRRDCRRYSAMSACGWMVLRFTWADVMHQPEYVARVIEQAVATRKRQPLEARPSCGRR